MFIMGVCKTGRLAYLIFYFNLFLGDPWLVHALLGPQGKHFKTTQKNN